MMQSCRVCHGTGQAGVSSLPQGAKCHVCMGARLIDTDRVCRCGHAATRHARKVDVWFCGRLSCDPDLPKAKGAF